MHIYANFEVEKSLSKFCPAFFFRIGVSDADTVFLFIAAVLIFAYIGQFSFMEYCSMLRLTQVSLVVTVTSQTNACDITVLSHASGEPASDHISIVILFFEL